MTYQSLEACLLDLEKNGKLIRIKEEVDPNLEMAAIHLKVYENNGPAILFEKVKGSKFRTASNIFGSLNRSEYIFKDTLQHVRNLIDVKNDPVAAIKKPFKYLPTLLAGFKALPLKNPFKKPVLFEEISIEEIPQIKHWPMDGGAFVTLPQVYTEDIDKPGIMNANMGMYRIQLSGNDYIPNKEIGLHYQLHRGIGVHQTKANAKGKALKVSIFVGGPPSHTVAAVMPLPEGLSEATFAGALGGRRFRYTYKDGFCISTDADFVITGTVQPQKNKPEGPFGDHLGYYSLQHDFPLMEVHKVYARKNAIWPFTVVGRPPQEDTSFGELIHSITGNALKNEIPGLKEVHAVDAAGVHPLLLAIGSERYTPYAPATQPAELLTIANHVLGTGQLSLAKFLFITADSTNILSAHNIENYFTYLLQRIDLKRDIHFYTNTTIDTLDYSGTSINSGSKVVFAANGAIKRTLSNTNLPASLNSYKASFIMPGIISIQLPAFTNYANAAIEMSQLNELLQVEKDTLLSTPMIIVSDDADFTSAKLNNFLWVAFTRTNPSHDIYGINSFTENKHWGCDTVVFDARKKPHHAPELILDKAMEQKAIGILSRAGFECKI
jgi:4-hydroxy-3-polyprenylbenzoate decarboxylase